MGRKSTFPVKNNEVFCEVCVKLIKRGQQYATQMVNPKVGVRRRVFFCCQEHQEKWEKENGDIII